MSISISDSTADQIISNLDQFTEPEWDKWLSDTGFNDTIMQAATRSLYNPNLQDTNSLKRLGRNLSILQIKMAPEDQPELRYLDLHVAQVYRALDELQPPSTATKIERMLLDLNPASTEYLNQLNMLKEQIDLSESGGALSKEAADRFRFVIEFLKPTSSPANYLLEDEVFSKLAKEIPNNATLDLHLYHEGKKVVHETNKKQFLALLQSGKDISQISSDLEGRLKNLQRDTLIQRFQTVVKNPKLLESLRLQENFAITVEKLGNYARQSVRIVQSQSEQIYTQYDKESDGKFSEIVKKLPHYDLNQQSYKIANHLTAALLSYELFTFKYFYGASSKDFEQSIDKFLEAQSKTPTKLFDLLYDKQFKTVHTWIAKDAKNIKQVYCQGYDSRTPGKGGCFSNSADRIAILDKTPEISGVSIPMGPTESGKFGQSRAQLSKLLHSNLEDVRKYMLEDNTERIGFDKVHIAALSGIHAKDPLTDLRFHVVRNFGVKSHPTIGIISFKFTDKSESHAINVQYDPQRQLYRLFDDNIGVMEYQTTREFHEGFDTYMKAIYPTAIDYYVYTYTRNK